MKFIEHITSKEQPWGKSNTPKRYLNPPFSENLVTFWRNGMVLIGEIQGGSDAQKGGFGRFNESVLPSSAMALIYRDQFLKNEPTMITREDGMPIHAQSYTYEKFDLHLESFCSVDRVPTAYTKVTIKNTTDKEITDTIGMIARISDEFDLIGCMEPDGYYPIEPSIYRFLACPYWAQNSEMCRSGQYAVFYQTKGEIKHRYHEIYPRFDFTLQKGEECAVCFAFGRGNATADFDYEKEKEKAETFWKGEFAKITLNPVAHDKKLTTMFHHLVSQILQMFVYPKGCNYVLLRQGGLQRLIWPTDVRSAVRALARIGNFEEYLDELLRTYFYIMQTTQGENKGEIVNFGIAWGSVTSSVLFSYGAVAKYNRRLYEKYKENAYQAFLWLEKQRERSKNDSRLVSGLFPPARSSDYEADGQMWADNDVWNLQGYELYLQGLEEQKDERVAEVKKAYDDYFACTKAVLDKAKIGQEQEDILRLPSEAHNNPETEKEIVKRIFSKKAEMSRVLTVGLAGYDTEDARRILRRYEGEFQNGLISSFQKSYFDGGLRWYVSWFDMDMYIYYRHSGLDEKAEEILLAQLNYCMTKEFYMAERYDDHDPNYTPWCPNCSANGRTVTMLCDWFIDRKEGVVNGRKVK